MAYRKVNLRLTAQNTLIVEEETAIGSGVYDQNPKTFAVEDISAANWFSQMRFDMINGVPTGNIARECLFPSYFW